MALPKMELPGGRFTLNAILRGIDEKLKVLFAPLDLKPPKKEEPEYRGSPVPSEEWEDEEVKAKPGSEFELVEVGAKKMFPEKRSMMDPKRMPKPKVKRPEIRKARARGKLQKNL